MLRVVFVSYGLSTEGEEGGHSVTTPTHTTQLSKQEKGTVIIIIVLHLNLHTQDIHKLYSNTRTLGISCTTTNLPQLRLSELVVMPQQ